MRGKHWQEPSGSGVGEWNETRRQQRGQADDRAVRACVPLTQAGVLASEPHLKHWRRAFIKSPVRKELLGSDTPVNLRIAPLIGVRLWD